MKDMDRFFGFVDKSIDKDPWVKDAGIKGYAKGMKEEADEVLEALGNKDTANLKEELGDMLYDWAHAVRLAELDGMFSVKDVVKAAEEKLKRRKPYLTDGSTKQLTKEETRAIWLQVKAKEKEMKEATDHHG